MVSFGKDKKGSIVDIFMIGVVLLFFAIMILIGLKMGSEFNERIQGMDEFGAEAKSAVQTTVSNYTYTIDNSFLFLMVGLMMATLVLAALVRIHPIFIPFFFIGLVFMIFLCGVFSNVYQDMAATSDLAGTANQLTFTTFIMSYLPFIVGIIGIILMVVMYKMWSNSQ